MTPTTLPPGLEVSARGSSNGQVSPHVDVQTKSACDTSHLHGTIFFALRGGLTYILWHDSNTRGLCPLLHRQTRPHRPAGDPPGSWGDTGADLYGSRPDWDHARPARPGSSARGRPCRRHLGRAQVRPVGPLSAG